MDTKSFHLEHQPAPEGILKGVASKGEFHENACNDAETTQAASEALLAGVTRNDAETAQAFGQDMGAAIRQKAISANLAEMLDKLGTNQVVVILRIRSIQLAAIVGY